MLPTNCSRHTTDHQIHEHSALGRAGGGRSWLERGRASGGACPERERPAEEDGIWREASWRLRGESSSLSFPLDWNHWCVPLSLPTLFSPVLAPNFSSFPADFCFSRRNAVSRSTSYREHPDTNEATISALRRRPGRFSSKLKATSTP